MSTSFKLFVLAFVLIASHNIDNIILYGFDPFEIITLLPYIVVGLFWVKMNDGMKKVLLVSSFLWGAALVLQN